MNKKGGKKTGGNTGKNSGYRCSNSVNRICTKGECIKVNTPCSGLINACKWYEYPGWKRPLE